jgi:predicted Zn-dependent protease
MASWQRLTALVLMACAAGSVAADTLTYVPVALGWSAVEVERATSPNLLALVHRAEATHSLGCRRHCQRLQHIFGHLVEQARGQSSHAQALDWSLTVVQGSEVDALALPGGQVLISEDFIDRQAPTDEALAFVLAHEMAHSVLEHERQALTFARLLLPRHVPRTVRDMYVEMDFNLGLIKAMEPVLQQGEFEADELGLLMASAAGYAPAAQLAFIAGQAASAETSLQLVATHPAAATRLRQLQLRLPLAERVRSRAK